MSDTVTLVAEFKDNISGPAKNAGDNVSNFGKTAGIAGAAVVGLGVAVLSAAKKMGELGAKVRDTAAELHMSTDAVQAYNYAFIQTGGSIDTFQSSMRGVVTFMRSAAAGGAQQIQVLDELNLTYQQLHDMSPEEQYEILTDRIGAMTDVTTQATTAATIFGSRYAQQVIGTLEQAGGSLRQLTQDFKDSDMMIPAEDIESLAEFSDKWTEIETKIQTLMAEAIVPILPAIENVGDEFADFAAETLPKVVEAVQNAVPVFTALTDVALKVAEGWGKLFGGDSKTQVQYAREAMTQVKEDLENGVANGFITASEASETFNAHLEGMIKGFSHSAYEQAVLRAGTDDITLSFNYASIALQNLLKIMGLDDIVSGLTNQFRDLGAQVAGIVGMISGIAETPPISVVPGDIVPDITDKKDKWISDIQEVAEAEAERAAAHKALAVEAYNNAAEAHNELLSMIAEENLSVQDKYTAELARIQELEDASGDHDAADRARMDAKDAYESELHDIKVAREEELRDISLEVLNQTAALVDQIGDMKLRNLHQETKEKKKASKDALAKEIAAIKATTMNEKDKQAAITKAKEEAAKRQTAIQEVAAQKEKDIKRAQQPMKLAVAISNIALGVSEALASGPPPMNLALAAITAAAGATEIATIASQKFATGGYVQGSGTGDSVHARLTPGEYVMTVLETKRIEESQRYSVPQPQTMSASKLGESPDIYISIPYQPTFSSATPGEMVKFTEAVVKALKMAGL